MPSGLRSGRPAGRVIVHDGDRADVTDLSHGELTRVPLRAGRRGRRRIPVPGHGPARRPGQGLRDRRRRRLGRGPRGPARRPASAAGSGGWPARAAPSLAGGGRPSGAGVSAVIAGSDVGLVPVRRLVDSPVDAVFALAPGDRPLVEAGESVVVGAPDRGAAARRQARGGLDPRLVRPDAGCPLVARRRLRPGRRSPHRRRRRAPVHVARQMADGHGRCAGPARGADRRDRPRRAARHLADPAGHRPARSAGIVTLGGPTRGRLHLATGATAGSGRAASMSGSPARSWSSVRGSTRRR